FNGDAGTYNLVIAYSGGGDDDDDDDESPQLSVRVGGVSLDSWWVSGSATQTRVVGTDLTFNPGDVIEIQGYGGDEGYVRVDYVEFVRVDSPTPDSSSTNSSTTDTSPTISTVKFEAEAMTLGGDYQTEAQTFASGGSLIKTGSAGGIVTATTTFTGATGFYDVVVGYHDENDGVSEITVKVAGVEDTWLLDQDLGTDFPGTENFVTRTVASGIVVKEGDEIFLQGIANASEYARIDYIEFIPVAAPELQLSDNSDVLRGGSGSDIIFGDVGNDVIYGEDEFNDGSVNPMIPQGYTYYTYGQSTYILSTAGTWSAAQAEAESLGGNLVTINDAAEETWLQTTFGTSEWLWIGFSDKDVEGSFQWANGEKVTYTNWAPSEPNNSSPYVRMNYNDGSGGLQWGDYNSDASLQGIIEIDWSVAGGSDFLVGGADSDTIYGNSGNDVIYGDDIGGIIGTLNQGLVGHWTFDETSGTQATDATDSHNGTLTNFSGDNSQWVNGQIGNALSFDGSNDRVVVSDAPELDITDQITLAAWINVDNFNDWQGIITKGTSDIPYAMDLRADGSLSFTANYSISGGVGSGEWLSNTKLTTNQWHHVAITYDGDAIRFYIDGQLDSNVVSTDITFATTTQDLVVGADLTGSHFDGEIDDARVYNRALNNEEITELTQYQGSAVNSTIPDGAITYNGSRYLLTDSTMTWSEAQAYAESLGGNLVTINDAVENQWLKDTFGTTEGLWIGFSDAETEGTWKWASGEVTDWVLGEANTEVYTDWALGQPDDYQGTQDYAVLSHVWDESTDKWDDVDVDAQLRGIIEIKLSGNDKLTGGSGHDVLDGGADNDILNGTDADAAGYFERDTLTGGSGADTFILGDATQAYYATQGSQDYVVIKDFVDSEDVVQLYGVVSDYLTQAQGSDVLLSRNGDLVAIFEGVNSLDITDDAFQYV
nr:lectin-like protein [Calothrix sp. MO_167.B12]